MLKIHWDVDVVTITNTDNLNEYSTLQTIPTSKYVLSPASPVDFVDRKNLNMNKHGKHFCGCSHAVFHERI